MSKQFYIFISVIAMDVEHFKKYFLVVFISSFENCLCRSIGPSVHLILCIFWILILCQMHSWQNSVPFCRLLLHSAVPCAVQMSFDFMKVPFVIVDPFSWANGVLFVKPLLAPEPRRVGPMFSSSSFSVSGFMSRYLIHLKLVLCKVMHVGLPTFFYLRTSTFPSPALWRCFSQYLFLTFL